MSRAGQCIANPVTGERSVVRVGTEDSSEDRVVVELFLRPGGRVPTAHVGTVHDFWNAGMSEAQIVIEIAPARRFEEAIKNSVGLAHDGLTNTKGMPRPLQLAAWVDEFSDVLYPASPPRPVQRILIPPLAALARLRGVPGSHARYRDWDGPAIDIDPWVSPMESALPAPPPDSAFPKLPPRPVS